MKRLIALSFTLCLLGSLFSQGINLPKPKAAPVPKRSTTPTVQNTAPKSNEKKITLNLIWEGDKTVKISIGSTKFFCQPNSQQNITLPYGNGFFAITIETPNQTGSAENFFNPEPENGGILTVYWLSSSRYPGFRYESPTEIKEEEARKIREILEKQKQAQLNTISRAKYYLESGQCEEGLQYFNTNFSTNGPIKSNSTEVTTFLAAVDQCKKQQAELETSRKKQAQLAFIDNCKSLIVLSNCTAAVKKFESEFPAGPLTKQSAEAQDFYAKVKTCQEQKKKNDIDLQLSQQKQFLYSADNLVRLRYCDSAAKMVQTQLPAGPLNQTSPEVQDIFKKVDQCKKDIANEKAALQKEQQLVMINNCESLLTENNCDEAEKLLPSIIAKGPLNEKSPEIIALKTGIADCKNAIKQRAADKQKQLLSYAKQALESGQCSQAESFYNKALTGPMKETETEFIELQAKIKNCQQDVKFNENMFQYNAAMSQYKYETALTFINEAKKLKPTDTATLGKFAILNLKLTEAQNTLKQANLLFESKKFAEAAEMYESLQKILPFWDKIPGDRMGEILKKNQFQRLMLGYYAPNKDLALLRKLADSCIAVDPSNFELKRLSLNIDYQTIWQETENFIKKEDYQIAKSKILTANAMIPSDSGTAKLKFIEDKILETQFNGIKESGDNDSAARFILTHPNFNDTSKLEINTILANYYYNRINANFNQFRYRKELRQEKTITDKTKLLQLANRINDSTNNYLAITQAKLYILKLKRRYNNGLEFYGGGSIFRASGNYVADLSKYSNIEFPNPTKTLIDWQTQKNKFEGVSYTANANIHHTWWKIKNNGKVVGHYFDVHAGQLEWTIQNMGNAEITNMYDKFSEQYQAQYPTYYSSIKNTVFNDYSITNSITGISINNHTSMYATFQRAGFNYGWRFPKSRQTITIGAEANLQYMENQGTFNQYPNSIAQETTKNSFVSPKIGYGIGFLSASYQPFNSTWMPITQNSLYSITGSHLEVEAKFKITRWWRIGAIYSNTSINQTFTLPLFTATQLTYLNNISNPNTQILNIQGIWVYTAITF